MTNWTFVTVTHNSASALAQYWTTGPPAAVRWLVVDNCSTDDTCDIARSLGGEVLPMVSNVGFSVANNRGLAMVESPYVAFVNPDVTVDWDTLDRLRVHAERYGALVAPALHNLDGTVQGNGRGLPFVWMKLRNRRMWPGRVLDEYIVQPSDCVKPVAWLMGAAVCGLTATFEALNGWNERYFIYYEDHDLGLRAWSQGIPVLLDGGSRWIHGWARATARLDLTAWRHELRSAAIFYASYPELLAPTRRFANSKEYSRSMREWTHQ